MIIVPCICGLSFNIILNNSKAINRKNVRTHCLHTDKQIFTSLFYFL